MTFNPRYQAVRPEDIQQELSEAEHLVVASIIGMINAELIRQRFTGPETFTLAMNTTHLTDTSRAAIIKTYAPYWMEPRIVTGPGGMLTFCLDAKR